MTRARRPPKPKHTPTLLRIGSRAVQAILTLNVRQEQVLLSTWRIKGYPYSLALPVPGEDLAIQNKHGRDGPMHILVESAWRTARGVVHVTERRTGKISVPVEA